MIWKIAKKEFLLNLMTFKFAVGTILCVVLMAVFMPVLVNDYQQRLKDYNANVVANEAEFRNIKIYKNITPTIYRPPLVLSIFSEGMKKQLGTSAKIEIDSIPEISNPEGIEFGKITKIASSPVNPYLSVFPILDVSLIFKIVISVLSLLMAYNVISGEREQGTLKLMLSSEIPRYQVLLGKVLAGLTTLIVPITTSFIVGLLIILFSPMVNLTRTEWVCIGLVYLVSLIFISAMYSLGLLFSSMTKRSAVSLVFSLFFWVFFLMVVPNGSICLADWLRPLESREVIDAQVETLRQRFKEELRNMPKINTQGEVCLYDSGAFGNKFGVVARTIFIVNNRKRCARQEPLKLSYANKIWEVEHIYLTSLLEHRRFANNLSKISPIALYENIISALAGTDIANARFFTTKAKNYRNEIINYIRTETGNFSSASYFTQCGKEDAIAFDEASKRFFSAKTKTDLVNRGYMEVARSVQAKIRPLALKGCPIFVYSTENIGKILQRIIPDLTLLVFMNVLLFVLSFVAFLRYDVR